MNVSSSLAGRLSMGTGGGARGGRSGRKWVPSAPRDTSVGVLQRVGSRSNAAAPSVGVALARRLGGPVTDSLSVGIKARLGVPKKGWGTDRAPRPIMDAHYSPYPPSKERREITTADLDRRRKTSRYSALEARRGIQDSGTHPPASPVMVKMASGKVVGGMRSDQIHKSPRKSSSSRAARPPSPASDAPPVVALDAARGLTVSVQNKARGGASAGGGYRPRSEERRRPPPPSRAARPRPYGGDRAPMYNEHDDRAGYPPVTGAGLHSDWDDSEEDVGLELRGSRRRHGSETMDVDSSTGGDVYNASLVYTRTTSHHHHHHHHGPSPPPQPPRYPPAALYRHPRRISPAPPPQRVLYRDQISPPHERVLYRDRSPLARYPAPRYSPEGYSPPPAPPSFHPRYQYAASPSPPPPARTRPRQVLEVARPKSKAVTRLPTKAVKKAGVVKAVSKVLKPAKKVKKVKAVKVAAKRSLKGGKVHNNRQSSPDTISSGSSSDSSSSSSSSSSVTSRRTGYKPPTERLVPEPHKQVLDPAVLASIASLQGKDPGYKSGPGPGVKNLVFVPSKTAKSLNQRFTMVDGPR